MLILARWMRDAGHRVDVVAPEGSETWSHGLAEELHMHPTPSFTRHLNRGAANRWARRMLTKSYGFGTGRIWHLRDTLRRHLARP